MRYLILLLLLFLFSCGSIKHVTKITDKEQVKTTIDSMYKKTESTKETEVKTDSSVIVTDETVITDYKTVKGKDSMIISVPNVQTINRHIVEYKAIKNDNKTDIVIIQDGTVKKTNQDTKIKISETKDVKRNGLLTTGNIAIVMVVTGIPLVFFLFLKYRKT